MTFTIFEKAEMLGSDWKHLAAEQVFFNQEFLQLTESCVGTSFKARYVVVYLDKIPIGILYFQVIDFQAGIFGDLITSQIEDMRSKRIKLFENYLGNNKNEVIMRLFTCGNNLVSGRYGDYFNPVVNEEKKNSIMLEITELISKEEKLRGTISATLLKDYEHPLEPADLMKNENYIQFTVEPNMVVEIPENIKSLEDYILLFSKKYRNRARAVLRAGSELRKQKLGLEELKTIEQRIYELYENVYDKAKFRLLKLPENYFSEMKRIFGDRFNLTAFFHGEELLAFSSTIAMHDQSIEAHYIGFDYSRNSDFDLYQNILYCNIEQAIHAGSNWLNLGRTAAEIKTTVGAKPTDLLCYIKPQNTVSKFLLKPFISFLEPGPWTPRNPFKEES